MGMCVVSSEAGGDTRSLELELQAIASCWTPHSAPVGRAYVLVSAELFLQPQNFMS